MPTVTVRAFGRLREAVGGDGSLALVLATGSSLRVALAALDARGAPLAPGTAVAVNGALERGDPPLRDGDEIALLPPVSGG